MNRCGRLVGGKRDSLRFLRLNARVTPSHIVTFYGGPHFEHCMSFSSATNITRNDLVSSTYGLGPLGPKIDAVVHMALRRILGEIIHPISDSRRLPLEVILRDIRYLVLECLILGSDVFVDLACVPWGWREAVYRSGIFPQSR